MFGAAYFLFAGKKSIKEFEAIHPAAANDTAVTINLTKENTDGWSFSDAFKIIEIIPLKKSQPGSRLTKIDKIFSYNSKYIITDTEMKSISVFSHAGDFERSIGSFGEDSAQFLDITDCSFDLGSEQIQVYSSASRGIITYDFSGKYLSYLEIPFFGYRFAKHSSGYLFFMNNNFNEETGYNNIVQVDHNGTVIGKAFHTTNVMRPAISFSGFLGGTQGSILSSMPFSDTIFKITEQRYYPKYIFNLGNCAFRNFETLPMNRLNSEMMNHCFVEDGFIDSGHILSFSFSDLKRRKTLLGYHFKDKNITITSDMFADGSLIWFLGRPKLIDGENLYSVFNTQLFLAQADRKKISTSIKEYSPELAVMLDSMSARREYNPILIRYKRI